MTARTAKVADRVADRAAAWALRFEAAAARAAAEADALERRAARWIGAAERVRARMEAEAGEGADPARLKRLRRASCRARFLGVRLAGRARAKRDAAAELAREVSLAPDRALARVLAEVANDARRAGELAALRPLEPMPDTPRAKPTPETYRRTLVRSVGVTGAIRTIGEMPDAVVRLVRAGTLSRAEGAIFAALRSAWLEAGSAPGLVQGYAERIDASRRETRAPEGRSRAWDEAKAALPAEVWRVVVAVVVHDVRLDDAPGLPEAYAAGSGRRVAGGAMLKLAAQILLRADPRTKGA